LIEVVHTEEHLIRDSRCNYGVQDQVVVLHMDGSDLEIILQIRASGSQRGAAAERRCLASLPREPASREAMFVTEIVIQLDDGVVAIAGGRNGAKEIRGCCGQAANQVPGPESPLADQFRRKRTLR